MLGLDADAFLDGFNMVLADALDFDEGSEQGQFVEFDDGPAEAVAAAAFFDDAEAHQPTGFQQIGGGLGVVEAGLDFASTFEAGIGIDGAFEGDLRSLVELGVVAVFERLPQAQAQATASLGKAVVRTVVVAVAVEDRAGILCIFAA